MKQIEKNACGIDRVARLGLGAALALLVFRFHRRDAERVSLGQVLGLYAAAELMVSGLLQWCPANSAIGRDTC